jgi:hypothetical protein
MDVVAVLSPQSPASPVAWLVLYIGPEVFMPVLSALAGALGVLLMFWQRVTGLVTRVWRAMFHRQG